MKLVNNPIRSFIAIELAGSIQSALKQLVASLEGVHGLPVRWLPVENIHLTLKFLGDVEAERLRLLGEQLALVTRPLAPFTLTIGGLGAFPSAKRPRVVWVGIQAPPNLAILAKEMESLGARFGIAPEDRPFSPHLTIGRVRAQASYEELQRLTELLGKIKVGELGKMDVESVCLFRSDLRPSGAIYTLMTRAKLAI